MHSIHNYSFDLLNGNVPLYRTVKKVTTQDGIDQFGRQSIGKRSPAFELISTIFVANYAASRALLADYAELIIADVGPPFKEQYALVKDGYNYQTEDLLDVVVLDVQPSDERQTALACGAIQNPGASFLCEARWRLRFRSTTGGGGPANVAFSKGFKTDAFT